MGDALPQARLVRVHSVPATQSGPNEDRIVWSRRAAVLVDGAGLPKGLRAGCRHGVRWYATSLADQVQAALTQHNLSFHSALERAIARVAAPHGETCNLAAGSPSATIAAWRASRGLLECLVLGDASVFIRRRDGTTHELTDARLDGVVEPVVSAARDRGLSAWQVRAVRRAVVERMRNYPGGFWCCHHDPRAAWEAAAWTVPITEVEGVVLASDGATRALHRFRIRQLGQFVTDALTGRHGELAAAVRKAERSQTGYLMSLGLKPHDDLSLASWRIDVPDKRPA
jgi:Protein phosphatase 2C